MCAGSSSRFGNDCHSFGVVSVSAFGNGLCILFAVYCPVVACLETATQAGVVPEGFHLFDDSRYEVTFADDSDGDSNAGKWQTG